MAGPARPDAPPGTAAGTATLPSGAPVGHAGIRVGVRERPSFQANGFLGLLLAIVLAGAGGWCVLIAGRSGPAGLWVLAGLLFVLAVDLDEERRTAMVSNLLVVLCGDSRATPIVNAGTLYS